MNPDTAKPTGAPIKRPRSNAKIDFTNLPDSALVQQRRLTFPSGPLPFSKVTLWRRVKAGTFPAPIHLDGNSSIVCWRWGDVRRWLEAQGASKEAA